MRTLRLVEDVEDEELEHSVLIANALAVLELTVEEGWLCVPEKANFRHDTGVARVDDPAGNGADRAVPHGKSASRAEAWEEHLVPRRVDLAGIVEGRTGLSIDCLTWRMVTTSAGPRYRGVVERPQANGTEHAQGGLIGP